MEEGILSYIPIGFWLIAGYTYKKKRWVYDVPVYMLHYITALCPSELLWGRDIK